ncbi:protein of unknown function [Streptomyces sp. KY75]|nr:protein of unknown function [Streptomyces sp. KY75]
MSVFVTVQPPSHREQLHLGAGGHQPLAPVQHVRQVSGVTGDHGKADLGPAVEILPAGLRRTHRVLALEFGDDRTDDGAFLLQRPYVAEEQIEGQGPHIHVCPDVPPVRVRAPPELGGNIRTVPERPGPIDGNTTRRPAPTVVAGFRGRTPGTRSDLCGSASRLLAHLVRRDDVVDLDVVEVSEVDTALEAFADLGDVVLEAAQTGDVEVLRDDLAIAQQARLGVALDLAGADQHTGDVAQLGRAEDLADLRRAELDLFVLRLEHALEGRFDLFDRLVDDRVVPDVHAFALGHLLGTPCGAHVEADHDGVGTRRQVDVRLGYRTHTAVQDPDVDLFTDVELEQRGLESLHRTGRVALDDEVELLDQTGLERLVQVLQGEPDTLAGEVGVALTGGTLLGDLTGRTVLVDDQEVVAGARDVGETEDQDGGRGTRFLHVLTIVVEHGADSAVGVAHDHRVADAQRSALDQDGRDGTTAAVEVGLDRNTLRVLLRVGPQVQRGVGGEDDGLQERLDVEALLGGDVDEHGVAAVLLGHQTELGELTAHLGRVGTLDVDLVDRDHDRHLGRLGVVQRLDRLGHHTVVGRHHEDRDVGRLRTTCTHGGERLVTRGVDEGDLAVLTVDLGGDLVRTDVLRDAAGLARDDVRLADRVQQSGLTVVDVTHDGHDRRTGDQGLFAALVLAELDVEGLEQLAVLLLGADDLQDVVHLVREKPERLVGDGLRRRDHLAEVHHHGDERRRVGVDLLREVGERGTARQPDSLSVAARQHDAADGRGLHGLVLLAPLPLRLTATTRRTAGTAERTLRAATATGTTRTTAEAGTAAEAAATTGTTGTAAATTGTGRTACEAAATATAGTTGEAAAATGTTGTAATGATATGTGTTATAGAATGTRA